MGGGLSTFEDSDPSLNNVIFCGNNGESLGGGMYNDSSNPMLTNVTFSGTHHWVWRILNHTESSPTLTNVTFSGNNASGSGGGMLNNDNSNPTLTNTILWGNTALNGPQIFNNSSSPFVTYSDIQDWEDLNNDNIDADPLFVRNPDPGADNIWSTSDDDYGDLRLQLTSPAIDAGDNTAPGLVGVMTDLGSNLRFVDISSVEDTGNGAQPIVDMGVYEANT